MEKSASVATGKTLLDAQKHGAELEELLQIVEDIEQIKENLQETISALIVKESFIHSDAEKQKNALFSKFVERGEISVEEIKKFEDFTRSSEKSIATNEKLINICQNVAKSLEDAQKLLTELQERGKK